MWIWMPEQYLVLLVIVSVWSAVWKAIALWKSARNKQIAWFVCIIIFNTIGLLEIIYLVFFQKKKQEIMPVIIEGKKPVVTAKKSMPKKK